ncbi:hypothetical protein T492DRAFT_1013290 [Pavlovales sp. CCMP2436]|nr:hypothetical protein T492DRAFT_1013290 [Pavlovales sp. CCMP2436]
MTGALSQSEASSARARAADARARGEAAGLLTPIPSFDSLAFFRASIYFLSDLSSFSYFLSRSFFIFLFPFRIFLHSLISFTVLSSFSYFLSSAFFILLFSVQLILDSLISFLLTSHTQGRRGGGAHQDSLSGQQGQSAGARRMGGLGGVHLGNRQSQ